MIDITELRKEDIGKWVLYIPSHERGRIRTWNAKWIFVVYASYYVEWNEFQDFSGVAIHPKDLQFITAKVDFKNERDYEDERRI